VLASIIRGSRRPRWFALRVVAERGDCRPWPGAPTTRSGDSGESSADAAPKILPSLRTMQTGSDEWRPPSKEANATAVAARVTGA
jgi:hypothetical protein